MEEDVHELLCKKVAEYSKNDAGGKPVNSLI